MFIIDIIMISYERYYKMKEFLLKIIGIAPLRQIDTIFSTQGRNGITLPQP